MTLALVARVWSDLYQGALENISMYVVELPMIFLTYLDLRKTPFPPTVLKVLLIIILVLFLIGFIRDLLFKRGIKDFYTLSYLSILMVWPTYGSGDALRYLVPLIPLLYYYFFRGFDLATSPGTFFNRGEAGLSAASGKGSRAALLVLFPVCIFTIFNLAQIRGRVFSPGALRQIVRSYAILGENIFKRIESVELASASTPYFERYLPCYHQYLKGAKTLTLASGPDDIIMTRKPEVVSLISGRKVIRFPYSSNEKTLFRFMEDNKVTHILLDNCYSETKKYIVPVTKSIRRSLRSGLPLTEAHSGILKDK